MNPTTTRPDDDVDAALYGTPTTPAQPERWAGWGANLGALGMTVLLGGTLTIALVLGYFIATGWVVPGW